MPLQLEFNQNHIYIIFLILLETCGESQAIEPVWELAPLWLLL